MIRVRLPPTFMPCTPRSQPLMTMPAPRWNSNGELRSRLESNLAPWAPLLYSQPLYVELQGGVGRDHAAGTTGAVAEFGRDDQGALAAHLHALHAFVPALDDHAGTQGEFEGVVAVDAGVELGALNAVFIQPAGVVHADLDAGARLSALANRGVFVLQARGGRGHRISLREVLQFGSPAAHPGACRSSFESPDYPRNPGRGPAVASLA